MSPLPHRVALFGGTFDPVHQGHLELVILAKRTLDLNRVIFIPCSRSPFKNQSTIASSEQRLTLLQLAIEELGWRDWASVSRFEIDREPPSYSWQTADHYREREESNTELYWIVGGDQWEQIEQWAEPERLKKLLHFIVVTRQDTEVHPREGWRATFLEFDHPASATAIREGKGENAWLPSSVAAYCDEHGLYGPQ